jgi:hypothetical protein
MGVAGTVVGLVASVLLLIPFAGALTSTAGFEIDANLQSAGGADWTMGSSGTGVINLTSDTTDNRCAQQSTDTALLICDPVKTDSTTFPGGAKEPAPSGWLPINTSQVTPKTDITNVTVNGRIDAITHVPVIVNSMERLPKAGDVHLDFEFNQSVTNLDANGQPTGSSIPTRSVGDLLIAYDLGGSVSSNLGAMNVRVFKAKADIGGCGSTCIGYDYANPDVNKSGGATLVDADPCGGAGQPVCTGVTAAMNTVQIPAPPWQSYDAGYNLVDTIQPFGFAEASIDVSQATSQQNVCVNFVSVKSRSSESVTSQLKDTTGIKPFPFCGGMTVKKYLDYTANGVRDADPTDTIADEPFTDLTNKFHFVVTGPSPATTEVCVGDTNATGQLACTTGSLTSLAPGTYTITETQKTDYVSTQRGSSTGVSSANFPSTTSTVTIGSSGTPILFGNICKVATTLSVTNADSIYYTPTGGSLTTVSGSSTTVKLVPGTSITWGYVYGGQTSSPAVSYTAPVSGACTDSTSQSFTPGDIIGTKFKDINADGDQDRTVGTPATDEIGIAGFVFELVNASDGSHVQYAVSCSTASGQATGVPTCTGTDTTGTYRFTSVNPGNYKVKELGSGTTVNVGTSASPINYHSPSGWVQTGPKDANGLFDPAITRPLTGTTVNVDTATGGGMFGNTPLSKVEVKFLPQAKLANGTTDATKMTNVSCKDSSTTAVGPTYTSASGNDYTTDNVKLPQSKLTCEITFVDP